MKHQLGCLILWWRMKYMYIGVQSLQMGCTQSPSLQGHQQLSGKSDENNPLKPNQSAPSIYIMIELCYFSLDQWEIRIHLLSGKCFNIPHDFDPHLDQTKFNGLLHLTIHGVLIIDFCLQRHLWDDDISKHPSLLHSLTRLTTMTFLSHLKIPQSDFGGFLLLGSHA